VFLTNQGLRIGRESKIDKVDLTDRMVQIGKVFLTNHGLRIGRESQIDKVVLIDREISVGPGRHLKIKILQVSESQ
tara:strand:+ start:82 stop:309 length:228 start_codon:yes stop_codon:yes gene_type:complete